MLVRSGVDSFYCLYNSLMTESHAFRVLLVVPLEQRASRLCNLSSRKAYAQLTMAPGLWGMHQFYENKFRVLTMCIYLPAQLTLKSLAGIDTLPW